MKCRDRSVGPVLYSLLSALLRSNRNLFVKKLNSIKHFTCKWDTHFMPEYDQCITMCCTTVTTTARTQNDCVEWPHLTEQLLQKSLRDVFMKAAHIASSFTWIIHLPNTCCISHTRNKNS